MGIYWIVCVFFSFSKRIHDHEHNSEKNVNYLRFYNKNKTQITTTAFDSVYNGKRRSIRNCVLSFACANVCSTLCAVTSYSVDDAAADAVSTMLLSS